MTVSDEVAKVEAAILAEGERVLALAKKGALELRKLNLIAEIEKIDADLNDLFGKKAAPAKAKEEAKAKPEAVDADKK